MSAPTDPALPLSQSESGPYSVRLLTRLLVPGDVAERLVGRPDDDSPAWCGDFEAAIADDPSSVLIYATDGPEVEAL